MSTFKLDDREIPFEPGDTIIRAAWRQGIEIPHYCWHPGLSVAANCRMCLVEVKTERVMRMPVLQWDEAKQDFIPSTKVKLQPACQTPASEGLEVISKSEQVQQTQAAVQEFLLLNHPVDCPICDQAGECKLQDYWLDHQTTLKRKRTEPVHKPKGQQFGPTIVYDAERCVMCTRCIRFCDEVAEDPVLDMRERGNRNEIVLSPGRQLDHNYSLMTEHVCPVGALTSRDFRFKARVWFLKSVDGVCSGCARGCPMHIDYDARKNKVYRLRPREDAERDQYWMCDDGMMSYKRVHEQRLQVAHVGRGQARQMCSSQDALEQAITALRNHAPKRVAVVYAAQHCSEDNEALATLAQQWGVEQLYLAGLSGWQGDTILRLDDNNPNRRGALRASGQSELKGVSALLEAIDRDELDAAVVLGWASDDLQAEQMQALTGLKTLVWLTSHEGAWDRFASVTLPVTSWAEMQGHFENIDGQQQAFKAAITPPLGVRPAAQIMVDLMQGLGLTLSAPQANAAALQAQA